MLYDSIEQNETERSGKGKVIRGNSKTGNDGNDDSEQRCQLINFRIDTVIVIV